MRINRILLMAAALIVSVSASAWAQEPPSSPHDGARRILRQRLSVDEKRGATDATSPPQPGTSAPTPTNDDHPTYNETVLPDGARVRVNSRVNKWPMPLRIRAIKLLAPGVGWAAAGPGLIWTTDNGVHWKDITPWYSRNRHEVLSPVFFLDRSRAWMTINEDVEASTESHYAIASTSDSGSTWTRRQFILRPRDYGIGLLPLRGGAGSIAFADPLHGWMWVGFSGETMNSRWCSFLLTTSDGGRSWQRASRPKHLDGGTILLVTPSQGWMLGSSQDSPHNDLYVTRDADKTWKHVSVSTPRELTLASETDYEMPTFVDAKRGYLPVDYRYYHGSDDTVSKVLFATDDGGRTWKFDCAVINLDEKSSAGFEIAAIAESEWIFAASFNGMPALTKVDAGARFDASPKGDPAYGKYKAARAISFVNAKEGWVVIDDGQLLSTVDGGRTWTDITPDPDLI